MTSRLFTPALLQRSATHFSPAHLLEAFDKGLANFIETYIASSHACMLPPSCEYTLAAANHQAAGRCEAYVCPECQQVWLKEPRVL